MDTKTAIKLVKKSHPFSTKYMTDEEAEALQTLIQIAEEYLKLRERVSVEKIKKIICPNNRLDYRNCEQLARVIVKSLLYEEINL